MPYVITANCIVYSSILLNKANGFFHSILVAVVVARRRDRTDGPGSSAKEQEARTSGGFRPHINTHDYGQCASKAKGT